LTPNITTAEKARLRAAGIVTAEDFESKLDANPSPVLAPLSGTTGIAEGRLAQLLADSLQQTGKPLKRDLSKHWLDVFVLAIFVAIILLVGRPWWYPPKAETLVRAAEDIPAFTVITENQLKVEGPGTASQQIGMKQSFVGKYSPELIPKGAIPPSKITAYQKTSFSGRMLLRLEIKSLPSLEGRTYPQNIELVFASRSAGPSGFMVPALLLASDQTSHVVTVALLPHDAQVATAWLGTSDVNLVWRTP
jgi:hypothetical protein